MEARQETMTECIQGNGGQYRWIAITALLLAIGTILRLVSPSIGGVTPNWTIAMYCIAINLTRPALRQAAGIGLVAGAIGMVTSKSPFPYGNLVSELVGALVCAAIVQASFRFRLGRVNLRPAVCAAASTFASGFTFVTILKAVLSLPTAVYLYAMLPVVFGVTALNIVITQALYYPAHKIFAVKESASGRRNAVGAGDAVQDNVRFTVTRGSFTAIIGPNGAGKTTLCLAVAGIAHQDYARRLAGCVQMDGMKAAAGGVAGPDGKVGIVLEDYESQLVAMTVDEEIAFSLENRGVHPDEIRRRTAQVLGLVGLEGTEEKEVAALSGGQKQRLAIAAALAGRPELLVLDEPASALDPEGVQDLYALLGRLNRDQGLTVMVVEQDASRVYEYADQYVVLAGGHVVQAGCADRVFSYLYHDEKLRTAVPPLWRIRLVLEEATGERCPDWTGTPEALTDIERCLATVRKGVVQSA